MHRLMFRYAVAAAALFAFAPSAATAQSGITDVVMAGRAHGVELPAGALAAMRARGPDAFEFEGVWKGRAARAAARRAALNASMNASLSRASGQSPAAIRTTSAQLQSAGAALVGNFRIPLLLGRPTDGAQPQTAAAYQTRMFGVAGPAYSLTTFYAEMSNGSLNFTGDVVGWLSLTQNSAFYYNNAAAGGDSIFGRTPEFLQSTLSAADPTVNFGIYDNDGPDGVPNSGDDDGFVDLAAFMYPAIGRECGGGSNGIWAHRYSMSGWGIPNFTTNDPSNKPGFGNIRVRDYIIQGGLDCDGSLQEIGVVAHEAGHGFGIPDLYDTGQLGNGIGEWGLMGSGNWNEPESPAHMEAHSKAFLGWIDIVTINADTALTIEPIFTSHTAYRVNTATPGEYFLLENRQRMGSEMFLNGEGLLIWHVDSVRYEAGRNGNTVNANAARKGLDLEEADGLNDLDTPDNRGDAGDVWPGAFNRSVFGSTSSPNSDTYTAGQSGVEIADIAMVGDDITLSIRFPAMVTFGDVNGDDAVTLDDLDVVMAYTIGATGPDYSHITIADVDDDGDVDTRDAYIIHAYIAGVATTQFRVGSMGFE